MLQKGLVHAAGSSAVVVQPAKQHFYVIACLKLARNNKVNVDTFSRPKQKIAGVSAGFGHADYDTFL